MIARAAMDAVSARKIAIKTRVQSMMVPTKSGPREVTRKVYFHTMETTREGYNPRTLRRRVARNLAKQIWAVMGGN